MWYEPEVFGCLSGLCECLEASLGLEPRLPVDRNLLYSDRVSEYRESLSCEKADPDSSGLEAVGSAAVEALWSPGKVVCLELDWL